MSTHRTAPPVRIAIITGASRGLGLAVAAGLARRGVRLVIDARGGEALETARRTLAERTEVIAIHGSITDEAHRAALVAAATSLGGLDLLINNAGVLGPSPLPSLATYPVDAYRDVLEIGAVAPLALTQRALPLLRARSGAVINVTSDSAIEAYEGWGGYGSAKAALEQLSRVLAAEEPGVRVWWTDPGDLRTAMHQEAFPGEDISDRALPETAVPGFLRLIDGWPPSGRIRVADLVDLAGPAGLVDLPASAVAGDPLGARA
jgi:NAD(P)-dependent dehydrogenase (short-subunit alcohol dehydrogenase family)